MKSSICFCIALLACTPASKHPQSPAANGTVEGTVTLVGGVPCPDDKPDCNGSYELVFLKADKTTVAGKTTVAADGKYTISLPPGTYIVMTPNGAGPGQHENEIAVASSATAKLDLRVDTGVRAPE